MTKTVNHDLVQSSTQPYHQTDHVIPVATTSPSAFKNLTFPLNAHAYVLLLQEGKAIYPYYGLFQNDKTSLQAAQQFPMDLLMTRLPPPPCRILEVGVGLGTTFSWLSERGYDVQGITPDAQQIAYIQKSLGSEVSVSCHSLEDFKAKPESFDVILLQESAQHIEPLVIFNQALDLLTTSGDLFIIDEFALKCDEPGIEKLHLLNDMVTLAERLGFELVERMDLSTMAAPTLDYLLQIIQIHRQSLIKDLALSDEQLTQLDASNQIYRRKYASGHYGYALLHFRKKTMPKWRPRILETNQIPEMFDLFKKTFNHDMTPATWQWKYGSNSGREIGVWRDLGRYTFSRGDQLSGFTGFFIDHWSPDPLDINLFADYCPPTPVAYYGLILAISFNRGFCSGYRAIYWFDLDRPAVYEPYFLSRIGIAGICSRLSVSQPANLYY